MFSQLRFREIIRLIANVSLSDTLQDSIDYLFKEELLRPARQDGTRYTLQAFQIALGGKSAIASDSFKFDFGDV